MADDKSGRDKQAHDAENRRRERDLAAELERGDEPEPARPAAAADLDDLEADLDALTFPATAHDVVAAVGDRTVRSAAGTYAVADLVPDVEEETFDEPAAVRERIERPTVAAAIKRIVEATRGISGVGLYGSQREAYELTLRELEAIDADDDDEGIEQITDWILERIERKGQLPGSRDVRRQAAKFCRERGYSVRNDEWLGV